METNRNKLMTLLRSNSRLLLFLPLVAIPPLCLLFWALGGGSQSYAASGTEQQNSLLQMPSSDLSTDKQLSKWDHYRKNQQDSASSEASWSAMLSRWEDHLSNEDGGTLPDSTPRGVYPAGYERQLYEKLAELDQSLHTVDEPASAMPPQQAQRQMEDERFQQRSAQLIRMAQWNEQSPAEDDPELDQLNSMLDKIIRIQQPAIGTAAQTQSQSEMSVGLTNQSSLLGDQDTAHARGFYSQSYGVSSYGRNAARAVIHEKQTIASGSTVKMRLIDDLSIPGGRIPKGTFIYGQAQISAERLQIQVKSVNSDQGIIDLKLTAYDLDGIAGIYLPEMISREVLVGSADQTVQSIGLGQTVQSAIALEAANAGIQAAKSLFSRKAKLLKVELKPDYRVLLKLDNNNY